ncbi:MAG: hydrogenase maturation peptidase HycI [Candidatus Bathyarchaeota archaeon]|nr:hydrogenase maturation peptidase HycI [Candidatus Bathyarchaeota archaeon]
MPFIEQLKAFLGKSSKNRVAILGIGSPIRGDDAVGLHVIKKLREHDMDNVLILETQTVPESFTSVLRKFAPTHVLMIDAAHMDAEPGVTRIIPTQMISDVCISTHKLPLTVLSNYLEGTMGAKVTLIGIQPNSIAFGTSMTEELKATAREITETIYEAIFQKS